MATDGNRGEKPGALLLMSNFSSTTGFAWNNIHRLFDRIIGAFRSTGTPVHVSFSIVDGPNGVIGSIPTQEFLTLRPSPRKLGPLFQLMAEIRRRSVRHLYLTDQQPVNWRYALLRVAGIRTIVIHNRISVPDPYPATLDRSLKGTLKFVASRLPFITADRVYAVSDFVKDRLVLKARFPERKVLKILNGIDLDRFAPGEGPRAPGPIRIFAAGRASKYKGVQVLLAAAARLEELTPDIAFRISYAGDGDYLPELKEKAQDLGLNQRVEFLGELPSTQTVLAQADIVVVPSIWGDACPSTVSEALASGKALIATEAGGIPEMVGESGCAILVPPGDEEAMARALETLVGDEARRRELGRLARIRAQEALEWEEYVQEVLRHLLADCGLDSKDRAPRGMEEEN